MHHELEVLPDADALARRAAAYVAERVRQAVAANGGCTFAVSGGHTPWAMFAELAREDVPWERLTIYQVDERVAPAGDPDRNLAHLRDALGSAAAEVRPMPVEEALVGGGAGDAGGGSAVDSAALDAAAERYGASLPDHFDVVHLGLGPDGHTASLVPGDPVLDVTDRLVATTQPYQDRRRMTLTYPALARARQLLWLVSGADKQEPLARLLAGDRTIPAGRVDAAASLILADTAAHPKT